MFRKTLLSLAVASSLGLTGCLDSGDTGANANPDYKISNPAIDGTHPIFNGLTQEFPVPNDILFSLETAADGTMVDGDAENPVTAGIGFMDGNSVTAAFDIKISDSLDPNQKLDARSFIVQGTSVIPNPDQNVFLLPLEYPGKDPLNSADGEVPSFSDAVNYQVAAALLDAGQTARATEIFTRLAEPVARAEIISLDGGVNNVIRINPLRPLKPKTKYLVVVTNDIKDASGKPLIGSPAYQNYRNPDEPLGSNQLAPFRNAILQWETLAAGYFGFMQTVFDQAGVSATAPTRDDIVFSMTFTTTAVEDVLLANAAPRTFFEQSQDLKARQDAITKLINGTFNLTSQSITSTDPADSAINSRIYSLLTDPTQGFRLFNQDLASTLKAANTNSLTLTYEDVAVSGEGELNTTLAFTLQTAASQAAAYVKGTAIASGAASVEGGFVSVLGALEAPQSRTTSFFDTDQNASDINSALKAPAKVSQGEITLPYFQGIPADNTDGAVIRTSTWTTNKDANLQSPPPASGLPPVEAPSDKVTYRFPFAGPTGEVTVPVLVTYPDESVLLSATGQSKPVNGWPVIIFQHGITTDRSASLPLANALAFSCVDTKQSENPVDWSPSGYDCFATVAIDQPLHGVVPNGSTVPGLNMIRDQEGNVIFGASPSATERHFNFSANAKQEPEPMSRLADRYKKSGSLFINLSNFANSRDNLRQGVLDLLNLNASIADMDIDGNPANGPDLDPSRVYFIGHSLGGINGLPFIAVNNAVAGNGINADLPRIQAAAILNSGGGVTKLLENSPNESFGAPAILAGLKDASNGVLVQGSSSLEIYFSVLQGLIDSTDPVTFASLLADSDILLTEVIGDQTIPNSADANLYEQGPLQLTSSDGFTINSLPAPLAGTEPLAKLMGAKQTELGELPAITRFTEGSHGTPVSAGDTSKDPDSSLAVFNEMVNQVAELFSSGTVSVTDSSVVED